MKVLMPDEVEQNNIITKRELTATVMALEYWLRLPRLEGPGPNVRADAQGALRKIQRTLDGMKR